MSVYSDYYYVCTQCVYMVIIVSTGPKMKFPTYFAFQYMKFPNISYAFLVEDSTKFHGNV